jgi:hypothetical protein
MVMTPRLERMFDIVGYDCCTPMTACSGQLRAATKYQMAAIGSLKDETG